MAYYEKISNRVNIFLKKYGVILTTHQFFGSAHATYDARQGDAGGTPTLLIDASVARVCEIKEVPVAATLVLWARGRVCAG